MKTQNTMCEQIKCNFNCNLYCTRPVIIIDIASAECEDFNDSPSIRDILSGPKNKTYGGF